MKPEKPELVAPSGDWSSLHSAAEAGADAVYFGVKGINMRHGASNFDILEIEKVMTFLHEKGKKGYLALNVTVYDKELDKIRRVLSTAKESKVDAVILWDMAVLSMAREMGLRVHLSTQASVSNLEAVRAYTSLGVERIVLARECTLDDIKNIISGIDKEKISCEVEAFIHGAMCVSISGRCFLSHHSFLKSANRGECIQPCRREFNISDVDDECHYTLGKDYILSPKDLCTVMFLDKLILSGISAFKIEGRMRPPEYVKITASVYRAAIDAFKENRLDEKLKKDLLKKLSHSFNRGFEEGFYFGKPGQAEEAPRKEYEKIYLGEVLKFYKKIGVAEILINAQGLKTGQTILVTGRRIGASFLEVTEMQINHELVDSVPKGKAVGVKMPFTVYPKDKVFIWNAK